MKLNKVQSTKKAGGKEYYHKYTISPVPKDIAEKSELVGKNLKAKATKGKIIIEEE